MIFLKGKRGDERYVSVEKELFNDLYNWAQNNDLNKKKYYLFVNPDTQKPYSDTWLVKLVRDYTKHAGIKKHITPHSFRRSFATNLYNNGTDLKLIQKLMGHKNLKTTLKYIMITRV